MFDFKIIWNLLEWHILDELKLLTYFFWLFFYAFSFCFPFFFVLSVLFLSGFWIPRLKIASK